MPKHTPGILDQRQRCPSCGRDYRGHDEPDVQPGRPCPADDCPARSGITPGPWMAEPEDTAGAVYVSQEGSGDLIALVYGDTANLEDTGNRQANARLIAAAPELLALVRDLHAALGERKGYAQSTTAIRARALLGRIDA